MEYNSNNPTIDIIEKCFPTIERIINQCRKHLFATKESSLDRIPPSKDALLQHTNRSLYQGCYCWHQSLIPHQTLPSPENWGWKVEENTFKVVWTILPEASQICKELVRCNCKSQKGCSGRCKCKKASLQCTELCKCGGECI